MRHHTVLRTVLCAIALPGMLLAGCASQQSSATGTSAHRSSSTHSPRTSATASPTFDGRTSCSKVFYIGDSTSIGMIAPQQIPDPAERLEPRMKDVGVTQLSVNISGGRAAIGRLLGRPNTMDVLTQHLTSTFDGCYFLALGANDAADAAVMHDPANMVTRINLVMQRIGNHPVLWPLIRASTAVHGPYANTNMQEFDDQLRAATKRYPNLRLYDWPDEMSTSWFDGSDGIHTRRIGSRSMALMYARALAVAFPQGMSPNPSAVVGSVWRKAPSPANEPKLPAQQGDYGAFWAADTPALKLYVSGPTLG